MELAFKLPISESKKTTLPSILAIASMKYSNVVRKEATGKGMQTTMESQAVLSWFNRLFIIEIAHVMANSQ